MSVPEQPDFLARAAALRARVVERAAETEEHTFYSQELHEDFLQAGLYRMLVPRRFGGFEVDLRVFYRVIIEIARADVSTAWCLCLAASHAFNFAALFGEQAQAEVFGTGDFRCPAVAAPAGEAVRTEEGWEVTGQWAYCSGSPYATHFLGQTFVSTADGGAPGRMLLFVAPRDRWTRLDDWGQTLGLKGSGSHSIRMQAAPLPAHYVLENAWLVDSDPARNPGFQIHGNPIYAGRTLSVFQTTLAALAIGGVKGAIEEYEKVILTRKTQRPPIRLRYLDPDYQRYLGLAIGRVAAAEAALIGLLGRYERICRRSVQTATPFTREEDLRLNIVSREALTLAWTALHEDIFRTAGTSAARNGERLERIFRDVAMDWGHVGNAFRDWSARELAREHLGLAQGPALRPDRVHTGGPS